MAAAIGFALVSSSAHATGMQGHIYMAECGGEQLAPGPLRDLIDEQRTSLANGAFFPDSGYTAADHDQGETASPRTGSRTRPSTRSSGRARRRWTPAT